VTTNDRAHSSPAQLSFTAVLNHGRRPARIIFVHAILNFEKKERTPESETADADADGRATRKNMYI
jgi:hypothetical protein